MYAKRVRCKTEKLDSRQFINYTNDRNLLYDLLPNPIYWAQGHGKLSSRLRAHPCELHLWYIVSRESKSEPW